MRLELHPKQSQVFQSPARQILFGGSAGPGKSHLLRVAGIAFAVDIPGLQIYLFRRMFPELYRNHMEGPTSFPSLLADWVFRKLVTINYSRHEIRFANGSTIFLTHLQHDKDVTRLQGSEIHLALIDELTHFTHSQYGYIRSRVRMTGVKVPERYRGQFPRILAASNPGSIGHNWVRALFIDRAPPGEIFTAPPEEGGLSTQFIPALLADNPTMAEADPDYAERLKGLGRPELIKAMLEGSWDIQAGGIFDDIFKRSAHVVKPFEIPASWRVDRSFDWGSSKPYAVQWWAESDGTQAPDGRFYPRGTLILAAQLYGWTGKANEGLRQTAPEIGRRIREAERGFNGSLWRGQRQVLPGPADPSIFASENGNCIAEDMARVGVRWEQADNSRVPGWQRCRQMLKASLVQPMEEPGVVVFDTNTQFLRTVPVLPRDERKPDDAATESEDH